MPSKKPEWEVAFNAMLTKWNSDVADKNKEMIKESFKYAWKMAKSTPPELIKDFYVDELEDFTGTLAELHAIVTNLGIKHGQQSVITFSPDVESAYASLSPEK